MPFFFGYPGAAQAPNEDNKIASIKVSLLVKVDDPNDEQCFLNSKEHTPRFIAETTMQKWEEVGAVNLPKEDKELDEKRKWFEDAIHDTIVSRKIGRKDACFDKDDIWNGIELEGLNQFDIASDTTGRRSRIGDAPMLRSLKSQFNFTEQLKAMGLNKYWAELGVLKGDFSKHLLQVSFDWSVVFCYKSLEPGFGPREIQLAKGL